MDKFVIASLCFTAGAGIGFAVGYYIASEKKEAEERVWAEEIRNEYETKAKEYISIDPAETEVPQDDDPDDKPQLISSGPARLAKPGVPGVNYSKVNKIVKEKGYTDPEDIQAVINDPDNEETYEERIERENIEISQEMSEYRKKNKDKIVPIPKDEWDTDFPEVDFDHKDLYYFTLDNILTDEDGNVIDEEEYIGAKPRQFGWMANDEEEIFIRNNPKETDFHVWKEKCASSDWWA